MFYDRVRETTAVTGTGDATLLGNVATFETFNAVAGVGPRFAYAIHNATGTEWETGEGYLSSSTVLVRSKVFTSSNANALVSFTTGTKQVFTTNTGALATNVYNATIIHLLNDFR